MDLFQPAEKAHGYETRSNIDGKFKITKTRTKKLIQHFQTLVRKVQSFDSFKSKVKGYLLSQHERD